MTDLLHIASALHTDSVTFFVGTGLSRYLTNNAAPNWVDLMAECAEEVDQELFDQLFTKQKNGSIKEKFDLLICAEVLEVKYNREGRSLKENIIRIIKENTKKKSIDLNRLKEVKQFFKNHDKVNIITTNYDSLFSDHIISRSRPISDGNPIPKVNTGRNIYHIHGSIENEKSIVATFSDYYKFINSRNYFSRKFYTLLQETTVVILGYSLKDFNVNIILNEVKASQSESVRNAAIFYVTRDGQDPVLEEFYYQTYGIKVIQVGNYGSFFKTLENKFDRVGQLMITFQNLSR
jgi:hypothetical protein